VPLNPVDRIVIVASDQEWPAAFERLAAALRRAIGEVTVEHIGSTAIPCLVAKPILDVAIFVRDTAEADHVREILGKIGYESEGEKGIVGREAFRRTTAATPSSAPGPWMDHHLYLASEESEYAYDQRLFREYLSSHSETARRYGILKESLAAAFVDDRDAYTERKGPFVRAVLAVARSDADVREVRPVAAYDLFSSVDIRCGTVIAAKPLPNARRPAIVLEIDFGSVGVLTSSAQVTHHYTPDTMLGRQVVAIVNFPPKQIGSVMSECLVLGASDGEATVLLGADRPVPNGARIH